MAEKTLPWCGKCRAGYCNTSGPPLAQKRAPMRKQKKCPQNTRVRMHPSPLNDTHRHCTRITSLFFLLCLWFLSFLIWLFHCTLKMVLHPLQVNVYLPVFFFFFFLFFFLSFFFLSFLNFKKLCEKTLWKSPTRIFSISLIFLFIQHLKFKSKYIFKHK